METPDIVQLPGFTSTFGTNVLVHQTDGPYKHVLTHQKLMVSFMILSNEPVYLKDGWFYTEVKNLKKLPLPQILFIFLTKFFKS